MHDELAAQIARMNADLAPLDTVPLHAARTAIARRDLAYFPRWVDHEVAQGRPPSTTAMVAACDYLDYAMEGDPS